MSLLQADIYASVYSRNRWKYDERKSPLLPLPTDFSEWSGEQFRHVVDSLTASATGHHADLSQVPLKDYLSVIAIDKNSEMFYPTLFDFVAYKSLSLVTTVNGRPSGITPRWLNNTVFTTANVSAKSGTSRFGIEIYRLLGKYAADRPAVAIFTDVNRLKWVYDNISYGLQTDNLDNYFNAAINIYQQNIDIPQSAIALLSIVNNDLTVDQKRKIFGLLTSYKSRFKGSVYEADVDKAAALLTKPSVSVSFPSNVVPGKEFDVKVSITNNRQTTVGLYTAIAPRNTIGQLIGSHEIVIDREGPFETDTVIHFTVPTYGLFTVVPSTTDIKKERNYLSTLVASDMFGTAISECDDKTAVFVSDAITGRPVEGASVASKEWQKTASRPVKTNSEGFALTGKGSIITITKGADHYLDDIYVNRYPTARDKMSATVFTSLPVYHLGDKAEWSAVIYNTSSKSSSPVSDRQIAVIVRDANYQKVDSVTLTTDGFGRIHGSTQLPETGLTGYFHITVLEGKKYLGEQTFMVSDYKLPTFAVKITSIERDTPTKGEITIKGEAMTYSGFPVADAGVTANIQSADNRSWFYSSFTSFHTTTASTTSDGSFSVTLDKSVLDDSPWPHGVLKASFDVTSPAGETRSVSATFSIGKPYSINSGSDRSFDIDGKVTLGLKVVDPMLRPVDIPLTCAVLTNDTTVVLKRTMETPSSPVDLSALPTGRYDIAIAPVDTTLADQIKLRGVILYHPSLKEFPIKEMMWTPRPHIDFKSQKGTVLIGTDRDCLIVNMFVSSDRKMIEHRILELKRGLSKIDLTLPDSVTTASIDLVSVNNLQNVTTRISVTTPAAREKLNFSIGSFRNKVTPNETETWTFTTRYPAGNGIRSAVMLNMFSQSINDILQHSAPSFRLTGNYGVGLNTSNFGSRNNHISGKWVNVPQFNQMPSFELYGLNWTGGGNLRIRGLNYHSATTLSEDVVVEEMAYDLAAPVMMKAAANGTLGEAKVESEAVADSEEADAGSAAPSPRSDKPEYRPSEIPLAIFQPMLTTDDSGNLTFSFTYPDASTTWLLNATAYDANMHNASLSRSVIASHPLMVQGNIPRFLRQNDTAVIQATVMNNTDNAVDSVITRFEVNDMNDNTPLVMAEDTLSLAPKSSKVIAVKLTVPSNASSLAVKVKASTDSHSDGELSAIAVMPASERVIETYPFFMSPDTTSLSLEVPVGEHSDVTLQFCQNAVWEVVTALPGLVADRNFTTANEAAAAIFSAAVADGIIKSNPEIGNALKTWLMSDRSDSTLVSMLQRNADLKVALLNATPWVVDAMNDTQRMTRLALLFDRKEIDQTYAAAIQVLGRLQRNGGGWAWTDYGDEASEWATENVLLMNGLLDRLGFLPKNSRLNSMTANAIKYLDIQVAKRKNSRGHARPDMLYTYLRTLYPGLRQPTAAARVSANTVQEIISSWKSFPLGSKAIAAQILEANGYHSTALTILRSLDEFATSTPERGMWWDNLDSSSWWTPGAVATTSLILDAYACCERKSPAIDKIRQWLILEKSRQNWGSSTTTSMAIASILSTGTRWTASESPRCIVRVNNEIIEPDNFERISSYMRADISTVNHGNINVTVDKVSDTPAYGAVYTSSDRTMSLVEQASVDGLSISKRFLVRRLTPQGESWEETNTFAVGDVVKTMLTVKADVEMSYVAIIDNRPACLEPVNQLPARIFSQNLCFYRETLNDHSSIFINYLPKGTYILEQEFTVTQNGVFSSGLATIQSQYAPQYTAHSSGMTLESRH